MDKRRENIANYDKKADNYDNTADGRFTEKFKDMLLDVMKLRDGDRVLDVGCGNGSLLYRLGKVAKIEGFGVDISPKMAAAAMTKNPNYQFFAADCEDIPFADASMDTLIACAAYHHFPNVDAFAAEASRLLKDGGSLYIAEMRLPPILRQITSLILPLLKEGDVKIYSTKEIANTMAKQGFRAVAFSKSGPVQILRFVR